MKIGTRDFRLIFNGVTPIKNDGGRLLLDVIGDGLPNILEADPSSVVVAHKARITVYGNDVYAALKDTPLDSGMRRVLFETAKKYIAREFLSREDSFGIRGVAKNALFLASLLDETAIQCSSKSEIARIIGARFPEMQVEVDFFAEILKSIEGRRKSRLLRSKFETFCALYEKHCD